MVTTLRIDGMRTVHCARAVFAALGGVEGIAGAEVEVGRAVIEHDGRATDGALEAAVASMGYTVRDIVTERRRLAVRETPSEPKE